MLDNEEHEVTWQGFHVTSAWTGSLLYFARGPVEVVGYPPWDRTSSANSCNPSWKIGWCKEAPALRAWKDVWDFADWKAKKKMSSISRELLRSNGVKDFGRIEYVVISLNVRCFIIMWESIVWCDMDLDATWVQNICTKIVYYYTYMDISLWFCRYVMYIYIYHEYVICGYIFIQWLDIFRKLERPGHGASFHFV